jgi:hypothetical protein
MISSNSDTARTACMRCARAANIPRFLRTFALSLRGPPLDSANATQYDIVIEQGFRAGTKISQSTSGCDDRDAFDRANSLFFKEKPKMR